jgi:hypothetical protein
MKQAIIVDLKSNRPVAKGEVLYDCPAYTYLKISKVSKHFAPNKLHDKKRHKFSKEFYDSELLQ